MSMFEYDQEKHMQQEREEAWEKGRTQGEHDMLCKLVEKKLNKGKTIIQIAEELEESEAVIKEILEDKRDQKTGI